MPHVVLAPDSFKGSLTATEVAAHLAVGLRRERPDVQVRELPVADGGEGTVAAAIAAGWHEHAAEVSGPLGQPVLARWAVAVLDGVPTAVVELAQASGLTLAGADSRAARLSSSRGTGEVIRHTLDGGARRVVLGIGGSACTDGGAGMLAALGARLLGTGGSDLPDGGDALRGLTRVDLTSLDPRLGEIEVVLASDVDNPLLGAAGAAVTYGPQKGADRDAVVDLEQGLTTWVEALIEAGLPDAVEMAGSPGAGAAGGVGYAALAVLGARRRPGIDVMIELTGLADAVAGAGLVVTGEGRVDSQTLRGKAPIGVAELALAAGVPTVVVGGSGGLPAEQLREHGIVAQYLLTDLEPDVDRCIADAAPLLEDVGARIARDL